MTGSCAHDHVSPLDSCFALSLQYRAMRVSLVERQSQVIVNVQKEEEEAANG